MAKEQGAGLSGFKKVSEDHSARKRGLDFIPNMSLFKDDGNILILGDEQTSTPLAK